MQIGDIKKVFLSNKYVICSLVGVICLGLIFVFLFNGSEKVEVSVCGDGTFSGECSLDQPYFCQDGILVENVGICGCPLVLEEKDGKCVSEYFNSSKNLDFKFVLDGEERFASFDLYGGVVEYLNSLPRFISYASDEVPSRSDFKMKKISNEIQREALMPLVVFIQNYFPNSKDMQAKLAVSLVQNIEYSEPDSNSFLNGRFNLRLSRYPYEVLYEQKGSCEGKSELLIFLLKELGYETSLFYFSLENHEAVGVGCPEEYSFDDSGYCFVETTIPSPISYSDGFYFGLSGLSKLQSSPEIFFISDGVSLGDDLSDYSDSLKLKKIVDKISRGKDINYFQKKSLDKIRTRYGLTY